MRVLRRLSLAGGGNDRRIADLYVRKYPRVLVLMRRRHFLGVLTCSLVVGVSSCRGTDDDSFVAVRGDRAKLVDPFESYESISTVQQRLKNSGYIWIVIENGATVAENENRPPFDIHVIRVDRCSNLGFEGALRLEFFNNRLMATWFYPKTFSSNRALIEGSHTELRTGQATIIGRYTRIEFGIDHERRDYVAWEDSRLREEFYLWIRRYS